MTQAPSSGNGSGMSGNNSAMGDDLAVSEASPMAPSPLTAMDFHEVRESVMVSELTTAMEIGIPYADSMSDTEETEEQRAAREWRSPFTPSVDAPQAAPLASCCIVISGLAETVKAADVHQQCSQFGQIQRVFMPRRRAHPVHGVVAFVTFFTPEVARMAVKAFSDAGFEAQMTDSGQTRTNANQPTRRGRPGVQRAPNRSSRSTGSSRTSDSPVNSRPAQLPPLTTAEVLKRAEERKTRHPSEHAVPRP
jgi:RNA recognition motif-containing protein